MSFRIEHIHVFIAIDEDDEEGVIGMMTGIGWMPFVAANEKRLDDLRPHAEHIAKETGKEVKLIRFSVREDLETINAS